MSEFKFGGEVIRKATDEQVITAVVYPVGTSPDLQGDFCDSPDAMARTARAFLTGDAPVWLEHSRPLSKDEAAICESFTAPDDMEIEGRSITKGTWVVSISIPDPSVWKLVREGSIRGISLAGRAKRDSSGRLNELAVREISLVSQPATGLPILAMKSEGTMTDEQRANILRLIDSIERRLELAKQEYMATKAGLEGIMADPAKAEPFLKSQMTDAELRAAVNAFCEKFERIMRAEFEPKVIPATARRHDDNSEDEATDTNTLFLEQQRARDGNEAAVRQENGDIWRDRARNRTR
jgi:hypothetical protein